MIKVFTEINLKDFEFWGPAVQHAEMLTDDEFDHLEGMLSDHCVYDETELNDFFAHDTDDIARWLGFYNWDEFVEYKENEKKHTMETCPSGDCECPYYANGFCKLPRPMDDCDDYAYFMTDN
jgi:hypothetical protein